MAKVILICGKLCSGKSVYTERIKKEENAVVFSCDELMLSLFDEYLGDKHDEIAAKAREYLFKMAERIVRTGTEVILDWGFWTAQSRAEARAFFDVRGIPYTFVYLEVPEDEHAARIARRNAAVKAGDVLAYYVDEGLAKKFASMFEPPEDWEIDERITE